MQAAGLVVLHKRTTRLCVAVYRPRKRITHTLPAEMQDYPANHNPLLAENPRRLAQTMKLGRKATWQPESETSHGRGDISSC